MASSPPNAATGLADFDTRSGSIVERALFNHRLVVVVLCALVTLLLGWQAQRDLQTMCVDAWRWQSSNPQGYRTTTP